LAFAHHRLPWVLNRVDRIHSWQSRPRARVWL
jgi:hypothetical protein